ERIYRQMQKNRVNRLVSSPFFVNTLARYLNDNQLELPLLKKVFTGGAPVFPSEASTYINAFPTTQVEIIYGSTEAEPISSISAGELVLEKDNLLKKGLNVGVPYRKTEVKIILITEEDISVHDERELEEWVLPSGRIGEIIVSGAHVLREYFNNEKALKRNKIFIGEKCWHRTGDSGYMENGQLYLTGRCNTLIPVEEGFLSPFTYENYFQTIEGVEIGTLMKIDGKVYAILEVGERQLSNKQSIERIKAQVLKAGVPCDEINIVSKIPRDPRHNSKIDYGRVEDSFN
ncbi:MAG: AMP-binding protein, partial [Cyclobacteriaceae bacterium]|nr:AMP-binding protein [Cyclobacteriaceae bacterium]